MPKKLLKNDNLSKSGYNSVIYLDFSLREWYNIARKRKKLPKNSSIDFMIETLILQFPNPPVFAGVFGFVGDLLFPEEIYILTVLRFR